MMKACILATDNRKRKNKHYASIGMDIDFPKPKISLRQAASEKLKYFMNFSVFFLISAWEASWVPAPKHPIQKSIVIPIKVFVNIYDLSVYGLVDATYAASV